MSKVSTSRNLSKIQNLTTVDTISNMTKVYEVSSCGVTLFSSPSKTEALKVFESSSGGDVSIFEIQASGAAKIIFKKSYKFPLSHSKVPKQKSKPKQTVSDSNIEPLDTVALSN